MIPEGLRQYVETEIIPRYAAFDKAHRQDHVRAVISRALAMGTAYDIDEGMLYAAAAFHDLGLAVCRETHHLESGRIIRADAGHYQTEQFAKEIIFRAISEKYCNFAVRISLQQGSLVRYI